MIELHPLTTAHLLGFAEPLVQSQFKLAVRNHAYGASWALTQNGATLCAFGLGAIEPGVAEGWFMVSEIADKQLRVAMLLKIRRLLGELPKPPYIICRVYETNDTGKRLARLMGFVPTDFFGPHDGIRVWMFS